MFFGIANVLSRVDVTSMQPLYRYSRGILYDNLGGLSRFDVGHKKGFFFHNNFNFWGEGGQRKVLENKQLSMWYLSCSYQKLI